jgi:hypoxanthine phosphoribosyltransferase
MAKQTSPFAVKKVSKKISKNVSKKYYKGSVCKEFMSRNIHPDIESVRITEEQIQQRIVTLGAEISRDYEGKDLYVVGILQGSTLFLADLVRHISIPLSFDFVAIASYGQGTRSTGVVKILKDLDEPVESRHVLIVEDVMDPRMSLRVSYLVDNLRSRRAASVRVCTLLEKPSHRKSTSGIEADYCGFVVDEEFVVGYGLDYLGKYRQLPYVGVLKPVIYGGG